MKIIKVTLLTAMMCILAAACCFASPNEVDWSSQNITVTGFGAPPAHAVNRGSARAMTRRAAVVDAYRQLAEAIQGVNVTGETTVENAMTTSDIVQTKVNAVIHGAKIVSERATGDGYEVTMTIPMFGSGSLASAVLPEKTQAAEPFMPATSMTQAEGNYTGVIIDCRGLGLNPVMSPVILNANHMPIYGYKNLDYDFVVKYGMAGYSHGYSTVMRAGAHPLIIKAQELLNHGANPVISNADADKLLAENAATHFLEDTRVVFMR